MTGKSPRTRRRRGSHGVAAVSGIEGGKQLERGSEHHAAGRSALHAGDTRRYRLPQPGVHGADDTQPRRRQRLPERRCMSSTTRSGPSAGLIVTEGVQPSIHGKGYPRTPGLHDAAQVEAWRRRDRRRTRSRRPYRCAT
jgi:hypothetical protein